MLAELLQTLVIFKIIDLAHLGWVKSQLGQAVLSWDSGSVLWALFSIGSANKHSSTLYYNEASARTALVDANSLYLLKQEQQSILPKEQDKDDDEASFETVLCSTSDSELPSIMEESDEDILLFADNNDDDSEHEVEPQDLLPPLEGGKRVSFSSADILVFDMTLGDNPSVHSGPPVQIDWSPSEEYAQVPLEQVSQYLKNSSTSLLSTFSTTRRVPRLSAEQRHRILRTKGHSDADISKVEQKAQKVQRARQATLKNDKRRRQWRAKGKGWLSLFTSCRQEAENDVVVATTATAASSASCLVIQESSSGSSSSASSTKPFDAWKDDVSDEISIPITPAAGATTIEGGAVVPQKKHRTTSSLDHLKRAESSSSMTRMLMNPTTLSMYHQHEQRRQGQTKPMMMITTGSSTKSTSRRHGMFRSGRKQAKVMGCT